MEKHIKLALAMTVVPAILALNCAHAFPLDATVEFNGHRYAKVVPLGGATWEQARANATGETVTLLDGTVLKGHLVTITSQPEQDFVSSTFLMASWQQLWLGGYQFFVDSGSADNWAWVTGEEIGNISADWAYHFLDTGQPGDDPNAFGNEDALRMLINGGVGTPPGTLNDRWHDFTRQDPGPASLLAYVIEFDDLGDNFSSMTAPPTVVSGSHWRASDTIESDWETIGFDDSSWSFAHAPYPNITPVTDLIPGTNAEYMWYDPESTSNGKQGPIEAFFRYTFNLDPEPRNLPLFGNVLLNADDDLEFYVNGQLVFADDDGDLPETVDLVHAVDFSDYLTAGINVLAIRAVDGSLASPRDWVYERVLVEAKIAIGTLGDFNNDSCVDRTDLDILLARIRSSGPHSVWFDINEDGEVNIADARKLVLLFSNPRGATCD